MAATPKRVKASKYFEPIEPRLELTTADALIVVWKHCKPLPGSAYAPADPSSGSASAPADAIPVSTTSAVGTPVPKPLLRRYYVEYKTTSAPSFTQAETSNCHIVLPVVQWGEPFTVRIVFRVSIITSSLNSAAEALLKSDFYVGERVVFHVTRPAIPHPLLASAPADVTAARTYQCHPIAFLSLLACTGSTTDPTGSVHSGVQALRPAREQQDAAEHPVVVECAGFGTVGMTKVAAVTVAGSLEGICPHNTPSLHGIRRYVILVASEGVDKSSSHTNRALSPDRAAFNVERSVHGEWLCEADTIVVCCGFGPHGTSAARAAATLCRQLRDPPKHQLINGFPEALQTDDGRRNACERIFTITFCSPMERFIDPQNNLPIHAAASEAATRFLYVLPRGDVSADGAAGGPTAGGATTSGSTTTPTVSPGGTGAAGGPSAPNGAAVSGTGNSGGGGGGSTTTTGGNAGSSAAVDPFDRPGKHQRSSGQSDVELGIPVEFVLESSRYSTVTLGVSHGTMARTADDETMLLGVVVRNSALIAQLKLRLLAACLSAPIATAMEHCAPIVDSVQLRPGRSYEYAIDIKGHSLDALRAVSLCDPHRPSNTYDVSLSEGRFEANRVILPVHTAVLLPFVHRSRAASGTATLDIFVATDCGVAFTSDVEVAIPATLAPFLASNRLAATSRDEAFPDAPSDLLCNLVRMESLFLLPPVGAGGGRAPLSGPQERSYRVLAAIDRASAAAESVKSRTGSSSVKAVFARVVQSAAAKISSDPLTNKELLGVPATAASHDAVRQALTAAVTTVAPRSGSSRSNAARLPQPDVVLQRFAPLFKRWYSALPFLGSVEPYIRRVVEVCGLLGIPLPPNTAEQVIAGCCGAATPGDTADSEFALPTLEGLLYHHVCGHISAIGVKSVSPDQILSDCVHLPGFVMDFSRVLLGAAKYADAKATDAESVFQDALAIFVICHIFCARVVEQFTRFTGVCGPSGAGVSSVLDRVVAIETKDGAAVTRSTLGHTVVREVPFTLPHVLLGLNLFHAVSIVVVLEDADCVSGSGVADTLEAMATLTFSRSNRKQHVGVFVSKLDELLSTGRVTLPSSANGEDPAAQVRMASAAAALSAMNRLKATSAGEPYWGSLGCDAGAVAPRAANTSIAEPVFVEHAVAALRVMVLASNV